MSFGLKVGRAIGATAAFTGDIAIRTAQGAGRFGEDVVRGTEEGYAENCARRAILREQAKAKRDAALAALAAPKAEVMVPAPLKARTVKA